LTSNQFYVPRLPEAGGRVILEGAEHHHLANVARVGVGRSVWLFNEDGHRGRARVVEVGPERTALLILEREGPAGSRVRIILAQALVPAKKMEVILQKAAEFGVSEFLPVETVRSLKTPRVWSEDKSRRWERIAREAAKQSKSAAFPRILPPRPLKSALLDRPGGAPGLVLNERGGKPLGRFLIDTGEAPRSIALFVGPEGGWTEGESTAFRAAGCEAVSLGSRILRAETAALAAVALVSHFWNG
jgi:16S rRNA (uracil1498-N3)-methyltransferase